MNQLIVFAGAGLSAESGLAMFRSRGGLWDTHDVNEVCNLLTLRAARHNPQVRQNIFDFYNLLASQVSGVQPNAAHAQIAAWQSAYGPERVKVLTTNIDSLLEKAGCCEVLAVHGNLESMVCVACTHAWPCTKGYDALERCPRCGSRLTKPGVVFFNEKAPLYPRMNQILKHLAPSDTLVVVGSSLQVIGVKVLLQGKAHAILVNVDPTEDDARFNQVLHCAATQGLPRLDAFVQARMKN